MLMKTSPTARLAITPATRLGRTRSGARLDAGQRFAVRSRLRLLLGGGRRRVPSAAPLGGLPARGPATGGRRGLDYSPGVRGAQGDGLVVPHRLDGLGLRFFLYGGVGGLRGLLRGVLRGDGRGRFRGLLTPAPVPVLGVPLRVVPLGLRLGAALRLRGPPLLLLGLRLWVLLLRSRRPEPRRRVLPRQRVVQRVVEATHGVLEPAAISPSCSGRNAVTPMPCPRPARARPIWPPRPCPRTRRASSRASGARAR